MKHLMSLEWSEREKVVPLSDDAALCAAQCSRSELEMELTAKQKTEQQRRFYLAALHEKCIKPKRGAK